MVDHRGSPPWRVLAADERDTLADLFYERRVARRAGGWEHCDKSHLDAASEHKNKLATRRKELWHLGQSEGWKKDDRRRRYLILKSATT